MVLLPHSSPTVSMLLLHTASRVPDALKPSRTHASRCVPWLLRFAYPLGSHIVMPNFFQNIEILGQERLPTSGPVILAPTHRSRWDALLVSYGAGWYVTGRYLRFMVTLSEMQGLQGWFIRRLGGFPVNPQRPTVASLRHGVQLLQNQESLVIFPEGGIFRDHQVHPLKPGLARLALQAESSQPSLGVQIVPIALRYSEPIPRWGCDVRLRIGSPLKAANYNTLTPKQGAGLLMQDLKHALSSLEQSFNPRS